MESQWPPDQSGLGNHMLARRASFCMYILLSFVNKIAGKALGVTFDHSVGQVRLIKKDKLLEVWLSNFI